MPQPFADPPVTAYPSGVVLPSPGLFAAGLYSGRVFSSVHCKPFSAALNAFESFSALTASTVKTLRKKVVSAARAQVLWGSVFGVVMAFSFACASLSTLLN